METEAGLSECTGDGTKCVECGKLFSHAFYFGTHIVTHLAEKEYRPVGQCGMCGLVFSDATVYQAHMMSLQSRLDAATAENDNAEESMQEAQDYPGTTEREADAGCGEHSPPSVEEQEKSEGHQPEHPSLSPCSEKDEQCQSSRQDSHQSSSPQSLPTTGTKQKVETINEETSQSEASLHSNPRSPGEPKPAANLETPTVEGGHKADKDVPAAGELPRKRIRRAPDKYEALPEERKRRVPKRKSVIPQSPNYDPEVEKYLQSLRDMGFSVAPDTTDASQGMQAAPAKRGRGNTIRGRSMSQGAYSSSPSHQTLPPQRQFNNFNAMGRGRGGTFTSGRGFGNAAQTFQPRTEGVNRSFQNNSLMNKSKTTMGFSGNSVMTSQGMPRRDDKQYWQSPSNTYNSNFSRGFNNRPAQAAQAAQAAPPLPKPKARYRDYDYEDEIINLIKGDLEVMPVSGKQTRGERLKQRQERLSQDGTTDGAKKSAKYFPRTEKSKAKRFPRKGSSPPNKRQHFNPSSETMCTPNNVEANADMSSIQIMNVHSLQPSTQSFRGRRGSRTRGRRGRWASHFRSSSFPESKLSPGSQSTFKSESNKDEGDGDKEFVTTNEVVTIRNVGGKMEDLREEARKKVEEMLASPGNFLMEDLAKPSAVPYEISRSSNFSQSVPPRQTGFSSAPRSARGRTRSRGRQLSRGRGIVHPGSSSTGSVGLEETVHRKEAKKDSSTERIDKVGDEEDKEEILDGADIDGWTVSISKMSDSDGEEEKVESAKDSLEKHETKETEKDYRPDLKDAVSTEVLKESDQDDHADSGVQEVGVNSGAEICSVKESERSEEPEKKDHDSQEVGDDNSGGDKLLKHGQQDGADEDGEMSQSKCENTPPDSSTNVKLSNSVSDNLTPEASVPSPETDTSNGTANNNHVLEVSQISPENVSTPENQCTSNQDLEGEKQTTESLLSKIECQVQRTASKSDSSSNLDLGSKMMNPTLPRSDDTTGALNHDLVSQTSDGLTRSKNPNDVCQAGKDPDDSMEESTLCHDESKEYSAVNSEIENSTSESVKGNSSAMHYEAAKELCENFVDGVNSEPSSQHNDQQPAKVIAEDNSVENSDEITGDPDQMMTDDQSHAMESDIATQPDQSTEENNSETKVEDHLDQGLPREKSTGKDSETELRSDRVEESVDSLKDSEESVSLPSQFSRQHNSVEAFHDIDNLQGGGQKEDSTIVDCSKTDLKADLDPRQKDCVEGGNNICPHSSQSKKDENGVVNENDVSLNQKDMRERISNGGSDHQLDIDTDKDITQKDAGHKIDPPEIQSDSLSASVSQNVTCINQDKVGDHDINEGGDSGSVYDDTDTFSEIEKTCQEIIRDAENQEEEGKANFENS